MVKKKTPKQKNAPTVITGKFFKFDGVGLLSKSREHIFLLDLENEYEKEKQITRGDWNCTSPAWPADGKSIAFISNRHKQRWNSPIGYSSIWEVRLTKTFPSSRISPENGFTSAPRYSPDGSSIVCTGVLEIKTAADAERPQLLFPV